MPFEKNHEEVNENVGSQEKNNRRQRNMLEIMLADKQKSRVFGMNFLEKQKGEALDITGAYDPKQEVWNGRGSVLPEGLSQEPPKEVLHTSGGTSGSTIYRTFADGVQTDTASDRSSD